MKIVVSGGSGFLGSGLVALLREQGHEVAVLSRQRSADSDIVWDPKAQTLESDRLEGCDAIVHLAGASLADGRWTQSRKRELRSSRVDATRFLVERCAALAKPPRVFVGASGINVYGSDPERIVAETEPAGSGFLTELCQAWEAETARAGSFAERVIHLRTSVVLDPFGGALAKMLPLFKLGLGGPLGNGRQWFPWIARVDWERAVLTTLTNSSLVGPVNLVAPEAVRQSAFAKALGGALKRPAVVPAPAFALRLALGEMADEALLSSVRAIPAVLQSASFAFQHPTLDGYLRTTFENA